MQERVAIELQPLFLTSGALRPRRPGDEMRGENKVRSKKWDLIEAVAVGAATNAIGSERKNSILSWVHKTGSVLRTGSEVATHPVTTGQAVDIEAVAAAACPPRLSAKGAEP
jgi:hypothetical protein